MWMKQQVVVIAVESRAQYFCAVTFHLTRHSIYQHSSVL